MKEKRASQHGSALFIILIVVSLFAALSFAVNDMLRTGSATKIAQEKSALNADDILDYARQLKQAIQSIRISNSCSDTGISFTKASGDSYEHSPVLSNKCQVFHINGGGIGNIAAPQNVSTYDYFYTGDFAVTGMGDDSSAELTLILRGVSDVLCQQINKKLGLATPTTDPSANSNFYSVEFTGTYTISGDAGSTIGTGDALYDDQPTGCFFENTATSGEYFFYQVLIPR